MYKSAILRELNGYQDYAPAEDYELFTRISDKYQVHNLDCVLVKYRIHDNNTSIVQSETGRKNVFKIKQNQLKNLQIVPDDTTSTAFFSLLEGDYTANTFADYLSLFSRLKKANKYLKKYPEIPFEKMLFDYWFQIIYIKKAKMNALVLLFNKNLFKWSFVSSSQLRKTFKLSIKGIGSISK